MAKFNFEDFEAEAGKELVTSKRKAKGGPKLREEPEKYRKGGVERRCTSFSRNPEYRDWALESIRSYSKSGRDQWINWEDKSVKINVPDDDVANLFAKLFFKKQGLKVPEFEIGLRQTGIDQTDILLKKVGKERLIFGIYEDIGKQMCLTRDSRILSVFPEITKIQEVTARPIKEIEEEVEFWKETALTQPESISSSFLSCSLFQEGIIQELKMSDKVDVFELYYDEAEENWKEDFPNIPFTKRIFWALLNNSISQFIDSEETYETFDIDPSGKISFFDINGECDQDILDGVYEREISQAASSLRSRAEVEFESRRIPLTKENFEEWFRNQPEYYEKDSCLVEKDIKNILDSGFFDQGPTYYGDDSCNPFTAKKLSEGPVIRPTVERKKWPIRVKRPGEERLLRQLEKDYKGHEWERYKKQQEAWSG